MTASPLVTIFCDAPNCGVFDDAGIAPTAAEARAGLRGAGWRLAVPEIAAPGFHGRRIARDYCPRHKDVTS